MNPFQKFVLAALTLSVCTEFAVGLYFVWDLI